VNWHSFITPLSFTPCLKTTSVSVYCNTVLAGAPRTVTDRLQRVLNAAARVVTGIWKFDRGLGQILHDELTSQARRPRPGVFQAGSDSSPVSERPRTAVPVGVLRSGGRCRHSAAPAFLQLSTACSASLPAQHLRPSGLPVRSILVHSAS